MGNNNIWIKEMNILQVNNLARLSSKKSKSDQQILKQNKDESSGFSQIMAAECHKYTDDEEKINKIIGG